MRKNLVIARVGANSLHRAWINPGQERDFDLFLCPFQDITSQPELDVIHGDTIAGPKWTGLRTLLNQWDGWRKYDYVWLPDDDIFASQATISAMFRAAADLRFDLFAPALHEQSFYAHFIAMRNKRFFARRVGFVEIMAPGFSRAALEKLLPTLDLTPTGWGWGLDSLWPKLLDYQNLGIIDATPVLHTRAVGQFRDPELGARVIAESDQIMAQYECGQRMTTFAAIGRDMNDMALDPDRLLVELTQGWSYLFEQGPKVLGWIVQQQAAPSSLAAYPISGLPSGPF
jgi:hypothetical protein